MDLLPHMGHANTFSLQNEKVFFMQKKAVKFALTAL
jgi:hypothetical protein